MANTSNIVVQQLTDGIARIKLNEPTTYNSLSSKTLKSLINIFKSLNKDNKTKVIIIEGSGKGFSAGHDLKEIRSLRNKKKEYKKLFNSCSKLMLEIIEGRKPVIAKVHGAAFAAGCQLVASCDLAISSDDAIFATPGVNVGLFCSTPMVAVSRQVSRKRIMKMLLTGDPIDAKYAKEIGLINDYYPVPKLHYLILKQDSNR
jgi:enoyl-CoA hydratase/carnithine racemase